jgi:signal peptidase I
MTFNLQHYAPSPALALAQWQSWRHRCTGHWPRILNAGIGFSLATGLTLLIAEPFHVQSQAMTPTLKPGDRLLIDGVTYVFQSPRRGDLVTFRAPAQLQRQGISTGQKLVKRIIGLPGETITVKNGTVYVNGQVLVEPYLQAFPEYTWGPYQVPTDQFFVLGDNRNQSQDSHVWGFLHEDKIMGRAWLHF